MTRTIAIEGEDPRLVIATVRRLGLDDRRNVSVARGIKTLLGVGAQRYAVIDIGTNSVKLHVAERSADGEWHALADRAVVTRLGEGLHGSARLGADPIARTTEAVATLVAEARALDVQELVAVGTAGLRIAENASELIAAVLEASGLDVEVISGAEEARLAVRAATAGLDLGQQELVVFDTGGGSTQFTLGAGGRVERAVQRRRGRGAVHRALRSRSRGAADVVEAACVAAADRLRTAGRTPCPRRVDRHGRGRDQPRRDQARPAAIRPVTPSTARGSTRRRSSTRSSSLSRLTADERRRSSACSRPARK